MPASRPYWKGYLKLSLVSCPIALFTATAASERVSFRQINRKTGHRLRQQLIDDVTREPVEAQDKGRGYEIAKNTYLPVEDEELEAIAIESSQTIEIDRFVPRVQIDERYLESPYYIVPSDQVGQEAFAVIREAMRDKDVVALGRVVLAKRERVIMLEPWQRGLLGIALRYAYEVRASEEYFDDIPDIKVPDEMLRLAEHILETKTGDFDPASFVDHYEEAVIEMLKQKQAGMPVPKPRQAEAPNVINLMDALRRSLAGETAGPANGPAKKTKEPSGKKARSPKPEDLRNAPQFKLPIAGGKTRAKEGTAETPKELPKPKPRRKSA